MRRLLVRLLESRLEPPALLGVLNVHVLDTDGAAVRVAQNAENLAQQHGALAAEAAGDELAVEVPKREAVARDVEIGVAALLVLKRVDVGHHVTAHAERVDQLVNASRLVDLVGQVDVNVLRPVNRVVGDAQVGEDALVEVALTDQQLVHLLQELAATGPLNDAVVVGARERDRLANTELGERRLRHALELGRVFKRAGTDDGALPLHEARHRVHGADAARVCQRDRVALEVGGRELVVAGALDDVFVGGVELAERHRLGLLDAGNKQRTRAVGLRDVDRDAEVDVGRRDDDRLAVDLVVVDVLARELAQRAHHGPRDQVGERDLAAASTLQVVVDDDAVVDHQLCGDGANARRRRNGERRIHVRGQRLRHTAQRCDLVLFLGRLGVGNGGGGCGRSLGRNRLGLRRAGRGLRHRLAARHGGRTDADRTDRVARRRAGKSRGRVVSGNRGGRHRGGFSDSDRRRGARCGPLGR